MVNTIKRRKAKTISALQLVEEARGSTLRTIARRRRGTRPQNEVTLLNNPRVRMLEQRDTRERVPSENEETKGEVR